MLQPGVSSSWPTPNSCGHLVERTFPTRPIPRREAAVCAVDPSPRGAEENENEDARKGRGARHEDRVLNRAVHVLTLYMFTQCFYREQSLRVNALMINPRSSEERLSIALFSCARLIKNGMTSATFPYGTSLATR